MGITDGVLVQAVATLQAALAALVEAELALVAALAGSRPP